MNDELKEAVEAGVISSKLAEALGRLLPGTCCLHRSWGLGRVNSLEIHANRITIDFTVKAGHVMQLDYAVESLQPLPANHILARCLAEPDAVRSEALENPALLVASILEDHQGKATVDQVGKILVPLIFDEMGFKKWFQGAKKALKADGRFVLPVKKSEPIVFLQTPSAPGKGLLEKFHSARFLKDQVAALDKITKALDDLASEVEELQSLAAKIEEAAQRGRKLQAAQAVELLLARDEILARHEALQPGASAPSVAEILRSEKGRVEELLNALPAAKQRRVLEHFPAAFGEEAVRIALQMMKSAPVRLAAEVAKFLEKQGETASLRKALARWISDRTVSTDTLIWLLRERGAGLPGLFTHDLLSAALNALERDLMDEKRGSRLQDLLLTDRELFNELLSEAPADAVRDLMRRLLLTPVFADPDKRSLIGRIIKLHPSMQSMISSDTEATNQSLTVSWPSLEARKAAYEYLVNVEIPRNLRDIAMAREQGDLRENFGYKAAKEQERVLARRRAEAERELAIARGTGFENPDTSQVSIGTVVTLIWEDGVSEKFSILGAWDSAPAFGIVSYRAAIGQSLLGKKVGESVELMAEKGRSRATINAIEPFTQHDLLRKIHAEAQAARQRTSEPPASGTIPSPAPLSP